MFNLPLSVRFEGIPGKYTFRTKGFRPPKKGEFYLSGAVVQAYRAPNDLTTAYHIVVPVRRQQPRKVLYG